MHSHRYAAPFGDAARLPGLIAALGLIPLIWCCAPGTPRDAAQPVQRPGQLPAPQKVPRPRKTDSVMIVAEVVRALGAGGEQDETQCVLTPCLVLLRVRSVLGYSQGFAGAVAQGDSLTVQWLQPRAFPIVPKGSPGGIPSRDIRKTAAAPARHMTGITAGMVIQAEIQSQATMRNTPGGGPTMSLRMYQFHVIEGSH